jgi:hypothetical protein
MSYKPRAPGSIFDALDRTVQAAGGAEIVAGFLGKTKWTVLHEIDPEDDKHRMSVRTLGMIAQRFKPHALAHYFASCAEGVFIPLAHPHDPRWDQLTAKAFEDMGRLGSEIIGDLADGKFDAAEAKRALLLVEEMQRHIATMAGMLRKVIDEERS